MKTLRLKGSRILCGALVVALGIAANVWAGDWSITTPINSQGYSYDAAIAGAGLTIPGAGHGLAFTVAVGFFGDPTIISSASGYSSSTADQWAGTVPVRPGGLWHATQMAGDNAWFEVAPAVGTSSLVLIIIARDP